MGLGGDGRCACSSFCSALQGVVWMTAHTCGAVLYCLLAAVFGLMVFCHTGLLLCPAVRPLGHTRSGAASAATSGPAGLPQPRLRWLPAAAAADGHGRVSRCKPAGGAVAAAAEQQAAAAGSGSRRCTGSSACCRSPLAGPADHLRTATGLQQWQWCKQCKQPPP